MANDFLCSGDRERVRAAVQGAEARTCGEIAVMVVPASDRYREGEVFGAFFLAGFVALVLAVALNQHTIWFYLPVVFLLLFPALLLFRKVPRLRLPLVSRRRIDAAVRERAVRGFFEKGLYRTRRENGILIFISRLERKVWILADRGIDSLAGHEVWRALAAEITAGIREGRGCDALCTVIGRCGDELARHFPPEEGDVNELPDDIIGH